MKQISRVYYLIPTFLLSFFIVAVLVGVGIRNLKVDTKTMITAVSPSLNGESVSVNFRVYSDASDFTLVALPDTQYYSELFPSFFYSQTQWIADSIASLNIVFVTHLGDIVHYRDKETGWQIADAAMSRLDGLVPYSVLPGNHDMEIGGAAPFYKQYFPASRYNQESWWGGSFEENKNNYQLFSAGGDEYIIVHLQYCPADDTLVWANKVLKLHGGRRAIISTHVYLTTEGTHHGNCNEYSDGKNAGMDIWNELIKKNPNIFLVLAGHVPGVGQRTDTPNGIPVYQLLSDYQTADDPNGYLRVMTFYPNDDFIQVTSYSPVFDMFLSDSENQFSLPFTMTGRTHPTGLVTISNGTDSCIASLESGQCDLPLISNKTTLVAAYSGDGNHKSSRSEETEIDLK